jgi:hypothetical protein
VWGGLLSAAETQKRIRETCKWVRASFGGYDPEDEEDEEDEAE